MVRLLILVLCCFSTVAVFADLKVDTVYSKLSTTTTVDRQLVLADGTLCGSPETIKDEHIVDKDGKVVGFKLNSDRDLSDENNTLVKISSETCEPAKVSTGIYTITKPGSHTIKAIVLAQNPLSWDEKVFTLTIGKPEPGPEPEPPTPPTPGEAPIEGEGFRVLFIAETGEQLPPAVADSFYSKLITDYLNTNCIKAEGQPEFRRFDPDTRFTNPQHRFAKAMARPRTSLPWLIISNGKSGYEGPFPTTVEATLALLKQYKEMN